jgi:hypothetical protein
MLLIFIDFVGAPISNCFPEKKIFGEQPPRRQLFREKWCNCFPAPLPQFFIPYLGILPEKTNILPFARKYLTQKND